MKKKIISICLILVLCLTTMIPAMAAEPEEKNLNESITDIGEDLDQEQNDKIISELELLEGEPQLFGDMGRRFEKGGMWLEYLPDDGSGVPIVPTSFWVTDDASVSYHGIRCGSTLEEVKSIMKAEGWEPPRNQGTFYLKHTSTRWYAFSIEEENGKVISWYWLNWMQGDPGATPFVDVPYDVWFFEPVKYVYTHWIMTGLTEDTFGPSESLARAQFAVILHRLENEPDTEYEQVFPDVEDGQWYTDAVSWANEHKIVTGYQDTGYFGIADPVNREQLVTMMFRYAKYKGYDNGRRNNLDSFPDAGNVHEFAWEAMQWAVANGIISGDNGKLNPQKSANRAECAAIITRFIKN